MTFGFYVNISYFFREIDMMWTNKSNEVPLQSPRHNQAKDSTRGTDFYFTLF